MLMDTDLCNGQAQLVVSLQTPHQVLMSDDGLINLLDWSPAEVAGRSMKFMMGPATDSIKIQSAVKNAGFLKSTLIHTVLYSRRGQSFNVTMHCSPYHDNCGQLVGSLIALAKSSAS